MVMVKEKGIPAVVVREYVCVCVCMMFVFLLVFVFHVVLLFSAACPVALHCCVWLFEFDLV